MTINFFLNNLITYYDRRLRGARMWTALAMFWIACSFGVLANVSSAHSLLRWHMPWYLAGLAGAAVSSVWNYAANQILTWRHRHPYSSSPSPSLRGSFHFTLSPAEIVQSQIETLPKENEEQVVA